MSWKRQDQVWQINGLSTMEKFVLLALAHYENETTGLCCPSCNSISKDLNTSVRTVRYSICRLKKLGVISSSILSTAKGIVNSYKFNQIEGSAILARCATVAGSENIAQCATVALPSIKAGSAKSDGGSAKYDGGSAKYDIGVVQPLHPNREDITEKLTEKVNTTTTTSTTKPSPPPQPTGGGGDAHAADFDDASDESILNDGGTSETSERDAYQAWLQERKLEAVRLHGSLSNDLNEGIGDDHLLYLLKMIEIQHPRFIDGYEIDVIDVIKAVYRNHGCDEDGTPIEDMISFLCNLVLGKRACFGIKIDHPPEAENAQEAVSTPSEPSERVIAPPAAEERATAAPTRKICEPAKPHQPKDSEIPTFADIRDRLDAKFGDTYDRAAVLVAYDKLTEAGWKDANGQPIRDPFRYLAALATAKQMPANAELEPYPDDETVRLWVEEDCQTGFYDLATALAARDRLFDDQTLRKNLRCGIRAYIVGAARRADAQATVRRAVG